MQPEKYFIRQATIDDSAIIAQLSVLCWQQAYKDIFNADFLAQLDWQARADGRKKFYSTNKNAAGYIAEVNGKAVGFCDVGPARANDQYNNSTFGEIYAVYVLQEFQKRGIGLALCKAACEHLIAAGFARCLIWTLEDNLPAKQFYKTIGCAPQAWRKENKVDDVVHKELAFTIDLL